jgi:hypothetical protein
MSLHRSLSPHVLLSLKVSAGDSTPDNLAFLDHHDDHVKKEAMSLMMDIPKNKLKELIHHPKNEVALHALHHPSVYEPHLKHALEADNPVLHAAVAAHPKITEHVFQSILNAAHIPVETKCHAVNNPECESHWLVPVLHDAVDFEHDDRHKMATHAMFHPKMPEDELIHFLHNAQCPTMRKMAALNIRSHDAIKGLLESDKIPMSVKKVLISNKGFNKDNWWTITDPHARAEAKRLANVE